MKVNTQSIVGIAMLVAVLLALSWWALTGEYQSAGAGNVAQSGSDPAPPAVQKPLAPDQAATATEAPAPVEAAPQAGQEPAVAAMFVKFRPALHGSGDATQLPVTLRVEVRQGDRRVLSDTRTIEPGEVASIPVQEGQTVEVASLMAEQRYVDGEVRLVPVPGSACRVVGGKVKLAPSPEVQLVRLYTTLSIAISIQYADGVAFNGKATALVEAPDGEKWIGDLDFAAEPPGSVLGVRDLPGPSGRQPVSPDGV